MPPSSFLTGFTQFLGLLGLNSINPIEEALKLNGFTI